MNEHPLIRLPAYEVLSRLARDDPQAFESLRNELIENNIKRAPERIQARLRGLQFRVDGIRRLSRSPLGASLKIQTLMWESFLQMNEALQGFVRPPKMPPHLAEATIETKIRQPLNARIIEFSPGRPPAN
ncbi:DUF3135 domain-containing protein [Propionivibrio sp.]|uniref:DUF3135 domain-containing protein n=1 Tax=Propionivibrio sp. TaxID=2212460 RepID=UPI003BF0E827